MGLGYWKSHSIYGPAQYDDNWAFIGEDTPFFNNVNWDINAQAYVPISWYETMHFKPMNAYLILANNYIAAQLNFLAGADPSAVWIEFGQATGLLSTYTWDYDWKADTDGVKGLEHLSVSCRYAAGRPRGHRRFRRRCGAEDQLPVG